MGAADLGCSSRLGVQLQGPAGDQEPPGLYLTQILNLGGKSGPAGNAVRGIRVPTQDRGDPPPRGFLPPSRSCFRIFTVRFSLGGAHTKPLSPPPGPGLGRRLFPGRGRGLPGRARRSRAAPAAPGKSRRPRPRTHRCSARSARPGPARFGSRGRGSLRRAPGCAPGGPRGPARPAARHHGSCSPGSTRTGARGRGRGGRRRNGAGEARGVLGSGPAAPLGTTSLGEDPS